MTQGDSKSQLHGYESFPTAGAGWVVEPMEVPPSSAPPGSEGAFTCVMLEPDTLRHM